MFQGDVTLQRDLGASASAGALFCGYTERRPKRPWLRFIQEDDMDYTALLMLIIVILIFVGAVWFWRVARLSVRPSQERLGDGTDDVPA
jgi:hypothetical protein